jgi:hypothetical protein
MTYNTLQSENDNKNNNNKLHGLYHEILKTRKRNFIFKSGRLPLRRVRYREIIDTSPMCSCGGSLRSGSPRAISFVLPSKESSGKSRAPRRG